MSSARLSLRHFFLSYIFILYSTESVVVVSGGKVQLPPSYCHLCLESNQKHFTFLGSRRQLEGIQGSNGPGEQTAQRFSYLKINYFASTTLTTWDVARHDCSNIFGPAASLLSLESTEEIDFLLNQVQFEGISSMVSYWTSGTYFKSEKTWKWGNGNSFPRSIPWAVGWPKVSSLAAGARVTFLLPSKEGRNFETQSAVEHARVICKVRIESQQVENECSFFDNLTVEYKVHLQELAWERSWHSSGDEAGTIGQKRRLEAIKLRLRGAPPTIGVSYSAHVQGIGWQEWVLSEQVAGTTGESKRLEALRIRLTGVNETTLSIRYRAFVERTGWQDWVSDGAITGTVGESRRIDAVQIKIVNHSSCSRYSKQLISN